MNSFQGDKSISFQSIWLQLIGYNKLESVAEIC